MADRPKQRGQKPALHPDRIKDNLKRQEWFHVTSDAQGVHLNLNVARATVPSRTLVATHVSAFREGSAVHMVFGQLPPLSKVFTGAVVITMSVNRLRDSLLKGHEAFLELLDVFAVSDGVTPEVRTPDPAMYPADRLVTERAAIMSTSFSDEETEMRFFRISPTDLRALQTGTQQVELIYPVIQIVMHTSELVHLVHTLKQIMPPAEAAKDRQ